MITSRRIVCVFDVKSLLKFELSDRELLIQKIKESVFKLHVEGLHSRFPLEWAYYFVDLSVSPMSSEKAFSEALREIHSSGVVDTTRGPPTNNGFVNCQTTQLENTSEDFRPYSASFTFLTSNEYLKFCNYLDSLITSLLKNQMWDNSGKDAIRNPTDFSKITSDLSAKNLWLTLGILVDPPFTWCASTDAEDTADKNFAPNHDARKVWSCGLEFGLKKLNNVMIFAKMPRTKKAIDNFISEFSITSNSVGSLNVSSPATVPLLRRSIDSKSKLSEVHKNLLTIKESFRPYGIQPVWVDLSSSKKISVDTHEVDFSVYKAFQSNGWNVVSLKRIRAWLCNVSLLKVSQALSFPSEGKVVDDDIQMISASIKLPCRNKVCPASASNFQHYYIYPKLRLIISPNSSVSQIAFFDFCKKNSDMQKIIFESCEIHLADLKPTLLLEELVHQNKIVNVDSPYFLTVIGKETVEKPIKRENDSYSRQNSKKSGNSSISTSLRSLKRSRSCSAEEKGLLLKKLCCEQEKQSQRMLDSTSNSSIQQNPLQLQKCQGSQGSRENQMIQEFQTTQPIDQAFGLMLSYLEKRKLVAEVMIQNPEFCFHSILQPCTSNTALVWHISCLPSTSLNDTVNHQSTYSSFSAPTVPSSHISSYSSIDTNTRLINSTLTDFSNDRFTRPVMDSLCENPPNIFSISCEYSEKNSIMSNVASMQHLFDAEVEGDRILALRIELETILYPGINEELQEKDKSLKNSSISIENEESIAAPKEAPPKESHVLIEKEREEDDTANMGADQRRQRAKSFLNSLEERIAEALNIPSLDIHSLSKKLVVETRKWIKLFDDAHNEQSAQNSKPSNTEFERNKVSDDQNSGINCAEMRSNFNVVQHANSSKRNKPKKNGVQQEKLTKQLRKYLLKSFDDLVVKYPYVVDSEESANNEYSKAYKIREILLQACLRLEMLVPCSDYQPTEKDEKRVLKTFPMLIGLIQFDIPDGVKGDFEEYCKSNVFSKFVDSIPEFINLMCEEMNFEVFGSSDANRTNTCPASPNSSSSSVRVNQTSNHKRNQNARKSSMHKKHKGKSKPRSSKSADPATISEKTRRGFTYNGENKLLSLKQTLEYERRFLHFHAPTHNMKMRMFVNKVKQPEALKRASVRSRRIEQSHSIKSAKAINGHSKSRSGCTKNSDAYFHNHGSDPRNPNVEKLGNSVDAGSDSDVQVREKDEDVVFETPESKDSEKRTAAARGCCDDGSESEPELQSKLRVKRNLNNVFFS